MTQRSNNSAALFRTVTALLWLALPITALMFASVWQQLPARVATHFDLANRPNGWMSREQTLTVMLAVAMVVLTVATWISSRITQPDVVAWGLAGLFYVILGTLIWAEQSLIDFNLYGKPVNVAPIMLVGIVSAIALVVLALRTRRGEPLPASRVFATETHASVLWALVTGVPAIFMIGIVAVVPLPAVRFAIGLSMLLGIGAAAMAGLGFRYVFSTTGLEVHTLGFRLRSIAASEIQSYAADTWNWKGGYGVRGLGNRRAYVWGNSGVRIHTSTGEVFLGHANPQRIVRDLDKVVQNRKASEGA